MQYKKVVRLYSNSRVAKYYMATNRNKNKAVILYFANMKIAQAVSYTHLDGYKRQAEGIICLA